MQFKINKTFKPVLKTECRYIHLFGGRARGASYFATDYFLYLLTTMKYFRGYLMRSTSADIKNSLWQDLKDRIEEHELSLDLFKINEVEMSIIYLPTGNKILSKGFRKASSKQSANLKSIAGATHIIIEEAEEVDEVDFDQLDLSLRTTKTNKLQIISLFNPPHKSHWLIKRYYNLLPSEYDGYYIAEPKKSETDLLSIHSTYYDNIRHINKSTSDRFEAFGLSNKEIDKEYYYVVVKGLISEGKRGRVFKDWQFIKEMPNTYQKIYGLDFGFTNDVTSLCEVEVHNNNIYVNELIYETGLTNKDIAKKMIDFGIDKHSTIVADASEPKSIQEIKDQGFNVVGSQKGQGYVMTAIDFLRGYNVYLTEHSHNAIFEYENFSYKLGRNKEPLNVVEDKNNHFIDSLKDVIYKMYGKASNKPVVQGTKMYDKRTRNKGKNRKQYGRDSRHLNSGY